MIEMMQDMCNICFARPNGRTVITRSLFKLIIGKRPLKPYLSYFVPKYIIIYI